MKKMIISFLAIGTLMASCSDNAVQTEDAKTVEEVKTATTGTFNVVTEGTHLDWKAWHLGKTGERFGKVSIKDAEMLINEDKLTNGKFVIDIASLSVENFPNDSAKTADLSGHLIGADFFMVDSFPTASFEITSVEAIEGDFNTAIIGNLTIKDSTKSISFKSNVEITEESVTLMSETFEVNREDWGLTYHNEGTVGVPKDYLIHNNIAFTIHTKLTK
jgi:polyisoprenoid-binding protein YceI